MEIPICEHIKDDGIRCGSPAKHGLSLCHFHSRMEDAPTTTKRGPYRVRPIDSTAAIQITITHTLQALLDDAIDTRKANSLFRGLNLALRTLCPSQRSRFSSPNLQTLIQQIRSYYETPGTQDHPSPPVTENESLNPPSPDEKLVSPPPNSTVKPKIDVEIPPNPYHRLARATPPLDQEQLAEAKRIIRLGPSHPLFQRCTRLVDAHIAMTKAG